MNIYLENGYLNMKDIIHQGYPFIFIIGARGTGKTYGALKSLIGDGEGFALMRRTAQEVEILSSEEYNPFGQLNRDLGWNFAAYPNPATKGRTSLIYEREITEDGSKPVGKPYGPIFALSTFASARGFGGGDIKRVFYDEFVPENHVRKIRDEGAALMNLYETINRNRELKGEKPLQMICASNSNRIDNDVLVSFGLVNDLMRNRKKGKEVWGDKKRGILVIDVQHSPISKKKAQTALYRATANAHNGFSEMALENAFPEFSRSTHKPIPINEVAPVVQVGEITIYKHKSKDVFYVSTHCSGSPISYGTSDLELERFTCANLAIRKAHLQNRIIFENPACEILLDKYMSR